jgi:hypothetical protein
VFVLRSYLLTAFLLVGSNLRSGGDHSCVVVDNAVMRESDEPAGGPDPRNPCPKCGAVTDAPGDGSGRLCKKCGWTWIIGFDGSGRYSGGSPEQTAQTLPPRHPEIVDRSLGEYRNYLLWVREKPHLSDPAQTAIDNLVVTIDAAATKKSEFLPTDVTFSYRDLLPLAEAEGELFANQFSLGCGDDGASTIFMGTEEAYEVADGSLAFWNCCGAVLWACGSKLDVMTQIDERQIASLPPTDRERRAFHIHMNDFYSVQHTRGRDTWEVLAWLLDPAHDSWALLENRGRGPSLGDLCYQIEVSAWPSKTATAGRPPSRDRLAFLEYVLQEMRRTATRLVFHGRPHEPHWGDRDHLAGIFLGLVRGDEAIFTEVAAGGRTFLEARRGDHAVLMTRALSGMVSNEYLDAVARHLR